SQETTYRNNKVILHGSIAHWHAETVQEFILQNNDGVGVTNGSLKKALCILCRPRRDDLKARNSTVPCLRKSVTVSINGQYIHSRYNPASAGQQHQQQNRSVHGK